MQCKTSRLFLTAVSSATAIGLAGCSVGPNYKKPNYPIPESFGERITPSTQPATQPITDLTQWWASFHDPRLTSLIERSVHKNHDLRLATQRILEARAARGGAAADFGPSVDARGGYDYQSRSLNTDNSNFGNFAGSRRRSESYSAGFDASWELDVFGGIRRNVESADALLDAAIENRRDILVSLTAEVARNYIELRGFQRQLTITRNNLATQKQTLELTQTRFKAGLSSDLDVARAEAQVFTTWSQIPPAEQSVRTAIHRLGVLLGQDPMSLSSELEADGGIPMAQANLSLGVPSELLRRRPDIRAAERNLASSNALIGVATSDLFPKFSLTGSYGLQSAKLSNLFDDRSLSWLISPGVQWRIWDWGRIRSNINVQTSRQEQALTSYEQTILTSLEEVENAMVSVDKEQFRRKALIDAVGSNRRAVDLAQQLYSRGLIDFLSVLETQRQLLAAEDSLVQSETTVSKNLVALYKALGGGWSDSAPFDFQSSATTQPVK